MAATYPITGIQTGITPPSVPLRLEVDSWYPGTTEEHLLQNSLFLWALKLFQEREPDEKLSYFQISGIHGSPYEPWDEDTDAMTANEGYCTHDSLLFPCWHRPYIILFEQILHDIMVTEVLPMLPEDLPSPDQKQKWFDAANNFRLPYWDWAQKKPRRDGLIYDIPIIAMNPMIEVVNLSTGLRLEIENPMYKFRMPNNERMGCEGIGDVQDIAPFSKSRATSRWAPYEPESTHVTRAWEEGEVDNEKITEALNKHHCAVDRLFAIWQALNVKNSRNWFQHWDEQLKDDGTWSIPKDTIDTPATPLAPFHTDTIGTYHTSDGIKDWQKFGYSYPELQPWLPQYNSNGEFDVNLYIADIRNQLRALYQPSYLPTPRVSQGLKSPQLSAHDYIINVQYKRHVSRFALEGVPYTLYFFICPESDLERYKGPLHQHQNHVGFVYTFSSPIYKNRGAPGCHNCRRKAAEGTKSRAQLPITGALVAHIRRLSHEQQGSGHEQTPGLGLDFMSNYLENNLHWRVGTHGYSGALPPDGRPQPNGRAGNTPSYDDFIQVSVYHRNAWFDDNTNSEPYELLENVTRNKLGGFRHLPRI
ncbi:hypothetical protein TWF696_008042 [Orbilia brochopaga]|uniref:tyrosinase n=1 Tax=Orbilia brochopaga TaxID=3140254 RepID=A0AAV9UT42_9PEZI